MSEHPEHVDYLHSVHYYPRNYVDDYRSLTAAGRVITGESGTTQP